MCETHTLAKKERHNTWTQWTTTQPGSRAYEGTTVRGNHVNSISLQRTKGRQPINNPPTQQHIARRTHPWSAEHTSHPSNPTALRTSNTTNFSRCKRSAAKDHATETKSKKALSMTPIDQDGKAA